MNSMVDLTNSHNLIESNELKNEDVFDRVDLEQPKVMIMSSTHSSDDEYHPSATITETNSSHLFETMDRSIGKKYFCGLVRLNHA